MLKKIILFIISSVFIITSAAFADVTAVVYNTIACTVGRNMD